MSIYVSIYGIIPKKTHRCSSSIILGIYAASAIDAHLFIDTHPASAIGAQFTIGAQYYFS
jgi:hypothetical protein